MRPVLATQFAISPQTGSTGRSVAREIARASLDWCAGWYSRKPSAPALLPEVDGGTTNPMVGHQVGATVLSEDAAGGEWELRWSYPSDQDASALWTTEVRVLWDDVGVEVAIMLSIASTEFAIRPFSYDVFPPRLVRTLVDSYACELAGRRLRTTAQQVSLSTVATFGSEHLSDPKRRLPIVLISREHRSNLFLVDPASLARDLCGLAEVWAINDKWTSFGLSDALGARLSCYDGAVRTYWPGFTTTADPYQHPLIFPTRLRALEAQGTTVSRYLVRHFAPVSALRFTDSERVLRRRHAVAEQARRAAEFRAREIAQSSSIQEIEAQLLEAFDAQYRLQAALEEALGRERDVRNELAIVKQNFALVSAMSLGETEEEGEEPEEEPQSVLEALQIAETEYPILSFWPSARDSASESHFARPDHVLRALSALAEVGQLYFEQRRTRRPLGSIESLFVERGNFKYAPSDSQTTITKYGKDRTFTRDGGKKLFERHLTLGGGDRQNCLQIYFDFDDSERVVQVGYCGVHLPYDGMRS